MNKLRYLLNRLLRHPWVHLPVTFIVLNAREDYGLITETEKVVANSVEFWRSVGILIQPVVRGLVTEEPLENELGQTLDVINRWRAGSPHPPIIYILARHTRLEGGNLGLAWRHNGLAAVVDITVEVSLDKIIDHELGHLLGLDHEDDTFMRRILEINNRRVTPAQRTTLLRHAYLYSGF